MVREFLRNVGITLIRENLVSFVILESILNFRRYYSKEDAAACWPSEFIAPMILEAVISSDRICLNAKPQFILIGEDLYLSYTYHQNENKKGLGMNIIITKFNISDIFLKV